MADVENKKKSRKVIRGSFTRAASELDGFFNAALRDNDAIEISWELLRVKYDTLRVLDSEIYELLLECSTEDELESEIVGCDTYAKKLTGLKLKFDKLQRDTDGNSTYSTATHHTNSPEHTGIRKFKLPRIEFKHYDGSIKDWLAFWAQFKKIHEDNSIDNHDKIEYLIQATLPGSRARQLVESYPAMSENYPKIIESLHSRFGREDLQIEVYIRGLLKLILTNSNSKQKLDIASLYDKIETQLRALETLGITSDKCSAMLFPLIESCLPQELIRVWQRSLNFNSSALMTEEEGSLSSLETRLKNLMQFLRQEVENEQRISLANEGFGLAGSYNKEVDTKTNRFSKQEYNTPTAAGLMNYNVAKCIFCSGTHDSADCFKARKMTFKQKKDLLIEKGGCFRCLKIGHQSKKCRGRLKCVVCSRTHVALMCPDITANKEDAKTNNSNTETGGAQKDQVLANQTNTQVFLQTIRVTLKGTGGSRIVRALIDSGSQRSYILKSTAVQLGYQPKRLEKIVHCLFGGVKSLNTHNCYDVTISEGSYSYTFEALDQQQICADVAPVFYGQWTEELKQQNIVISDYNPGPIELLLGADVAGCLYTGVRRKLPCGLYAVETHVGWTVMGKIPMDTRSDLTMTTLNLFVKDASISDLWELETLGIKEPSDRISKDEMAKEAQELFLQTVTVDQEGRYEVRLPWLDGHPPLPTNYKLAQKRLNTAVNKLKGNGLLEQYGQIFAKWESEGIIEQVDATSSLEVNQGHYLPHRPVVKESSVTTKIRPVFDASAHETARPALNHCLGKGPNLIELIPSMLLRFRENKIGVISDIKKAFLQISINEKDRDFLRFLWMNAQNEEIILRHRRVVFGVNSSPFLLGATLEYHLSKCLEKCSNPDVGYSKETVEKLKRSFYVDNCVYSVPDEESLNKFIRESMAIMIEGQFELRGWERTQNEGSERVSDPCPVLGLIWDSQKDILTINQGFLENDLDIDNMVISKRQILSITQKIFDPIGYTCAAVLVPKLILQKLWKEELTWDQSVDNQTEINFRNWLKEVHYLMKIEIPRWVRTGEAEAQDSSLHTFCDASGDAYASAVFLRIVFDGNVSIFLLAAKARVAPLKKTDVKMTIPRLELLAATIGARLYAHVTKNLESKINSYFWSDSSTFISWIQRTEEWGVFVWNRVDEIRSLTDADRWRHLPGIHNPADLPSRGCSPRQLFNSKWWEGPRWLYEDPKNWPCVSAAYNEEEIGAERKKKLVNALINVGETCDWHLDYFSKYNMTIRMIAWIFRFIHNSRYTNQKRHGELIVQELEEAEIFVLKLTQQEVFSGQDDKRISNLGAFCDDKGLIRLKSRVSNRDDAEDYCFPIVLPSKQPLVNRLIMDAHRRACHVGTQGLLSKLREKFWILGGRRTIRSVTSKCVTCKRFNAKPLVVEPPPLPLDRVRDAMAFEVVGIDFAGPLFLRNGEKAWICLFTCAVYRAVHLELTTSMSTTSFLQALRRFVSRRGRPKTIYTDNGTNFLGAENALSQLDWNAIIRQTSVERICWRFNPPTAAWWGGFWERLIGVLKSLLRKVLGRASLDYEDLLTLVCDCEAVINARPITYLSEDPKDLFALTPSMFLRDQVECGLPDCDVIDRDSLCRKVRKIHTLREDLQVRFRTEYLGQLKLLCDKKSDRQIKLGEIVLVGNDNSKRLDWPIGKVVEILPGKDGQIRLVRVQTTRGHLLRPLQRLYPLECSSVPEFQSREKKCQQADPVKAVPEDPDASHSDFYQEDGVSAEVPSVKLTRSGRVTKVPKRFL